MANCSMSINRETLEEYVDKITTGIRENVDFAVIGLSGGIDSTLCAALCAKALGNENVLGVHMPAIGVTNRLTPYKCYSLARKLGIHYCESSIISVSEVTGDLHSYYSILHYITKGEPWMGISRVTRGNAMARERMKRLYSICNDLSEKLADGNKRVRVIGTGNLSEDFIGYMTKGGDALADYFPIAQLFKSEVYAIADMFADDGVISDEHINRKPSADLWIGQTDDDELKDQGLPSYDAQEPYIRYMIANYSPLLLHNISQKEIEAAGLFVELFYKIWDRHRANLHKLLPPPVVSLGRDYL